jgi:hypothetical protein
MILFAQPQRHARRRAQGIIGVSPVFPILAKGDDQPERLSRGPITALTAICQSLAIAFSHSASECLRSGIIALQAFISEVPAATPPAT